MSFRVRTAHIENPTPATQPPNTRLDIVSPGLPTIPTFTPTHTLSQRENVIPYIPPISIQDYEKNLREENSEKKEKDVIVHDKTNDKWILVKESESYRYFVN